MVAISGKNWTLAPSLQAMFKQFDQAFPGRDHASDGSIGDASHSARTSDHNPLGGWVHAGDIDEDLGKEDLRGFVARIQQRQDPRVQYVIYEGRILKSYASNGLAAWQWHTYTGPNKHSIHAHVSIKHTHAARSDLSPWYVKGGQAQTPTPPVLPIGEDEDMANLLVRGDKTGHWWFTDGLTKRYVTTVEEAAVHVYVGLAKWNKGGPYVLGQNIVDLIPVLPGDGIPGHVGVADAVRKVLAE